MCIYFCFDTLQDLKQKQNESLPVLMPGDRIAKFIAMPCPCEPLRAQKIIVEVQKPLKPQHIAVPLDWSIPNVNITDIL